jgi:HEAT repeat protein
MFRSSLVLGATLLSAALVLGPSPLLAHGGQYRGPRDIVPPGGGGNSPGTPGVPTPPTGPGGPNGPGAPTTGTSPGGSTGPGVSTPGANPLSGGMDVTESYNDWSFWWGFNKDRFLDLKGKLASIGVTTGSDEFELGFLGPKGSDKIGIDRETVQRLVYPVLRRVLEDEKRSADELSSALVALAKLGVEQEASVELIAKHLEAKNQEVSETAAVALGILAHPEGLPLLTSLLRDEAPARRRVGRHEVPLRTRAFAAYGLGLIGHAAQGEASAAMLARIEAELLAAFRREGEALDDLKVATLSALSLLPLEPQRAQVLTETVLLPLLQDQRTNGLDVVRAHAATTLARWTRRCGPEHPLTRSASASCIALLAQRKQNALVAQSLALALGVIEANRGEQAEAGVKALVGYGDDGRDQQARYFSTIALGQIGGPTALQHLRKVLSKGKNHERSWAALALGVRAFEDRTNEAAAKDGSAAAEVLLALRKDRDPSLRGAYSISLGLMRHEPAREVLEAELLEANVESQKGNAGIGLGLLGVTTSRELIQQELGKSKRRPDQLQSLAIALGLLGDPSVVDLLIATMKEARTTSVHAALAQALGFIGDQRSLAPLAEMATAEELTAEARAFALVALGIACDKERLPWNAKIAENTNYRATVSTLTGSALGVLDIL